MKEVRLGYIDGSCLWSFSIKRVPKRPHSPLQIEIYNRTENPLTHSSFSKEKEEAEEEGRTHRSPNRMHLPFLSLVLVLDPSSHLHEPQPTLSPARESPRWYRAYLVPRQQTFFLFSPLSASLSPSSDHSSKFPTE